MGIVNVYGLIDPRTGEYRYVGVSRHDPQFRLRGHMAEARARKHITYKNNWLWELDQLNLRPIVELLEIALEDDWHEKEMSWIADFMNRGYRLTNANAGGKGGRIPDEQTRLKLSESHKGYAMPLEQRAKISAALKGKTKSIETRAKMSEFAKTKDLTPLLEANRKKQVPHGGGTQGRQGCKCEPCRLTRNSYSAERRRNKRRAR